MKRGEGERQRTEGVGGCGAKRKGKKKMSVQTKGRTKRSKVWKRGPDDGTINVDTNGEWMRVKIEII